MAKEENSVWEGRAATSVSCSPTDQAAFILLACAPAARSGRGRCRRSRAAPPAGQTTRSKCLWAAPCIAAVGRLPLQAEAGWAAAGWAAAGWVEG